MGDRMRKTFIAGGVVLILGLVGVAYSPPCPPSSGDRSSPSPTAALQVGTQVGQLAPDFTLPILGTDDQVSLSDLRGCVVLLEFWASWCGPCWTSSPHVEELAARYRSQGLVSLGVSLDRFPQPAQQFISSLGLSDVIPLWGSFQQVLEVARAYAVSTIPHVYLIDRQGVIRFSGHPAYLTQELIEEILASP